MDKVRRVIIEAGKVTLEGAGGDTETLELVKGPLDAGGFDIVPGKRTVVLFALAAVVTCALVVAVIL